MASHHFPYPRTKHPTDDGVYWIRLPKTESWSMGRLVGGQTPYPVILGGISGSAIPLSSLTGSEFAGPIPEPREEAPENVAESPVAVRSISLVDDWPLFGPDSIGQVGLVEKEPDEYEDEDDDHA